MSSFEFKDNTFVNIVDILQYFIEESTFYFTKDKIRIVTVDKCLTCLVSIELNHPFSEVKMKNKEEKISVNLVSLGKVLKCKNIMDKCKIILKDSKLEIVFTKSKGKGYEKYKVSQINSENEELEDIEIEPNKVVRLNTKFLSSVCKKIAKFDESIIFSIKNEFLYVKTGNNEDVELKIEKGFDLLDIEVNEEVDVKFLIKYINLFSKAEIFCEEMSMILDDEDEPTMFSFDFNDNHIKFFLTPQVDDE
jgi:proliferating cell nuclear antigen